MDRNDLGDLAAFVAVARERSFTKASAKLRISQSTLSHTMRELEERLGVRLLTRTTRSVATTDAGERLLQVVGPRYDDIEAELIALTGLRNTPSGIVRITTGLHPAETILWPALETFLSKFPEINVELNIDAGLTNIVEERYDAGVRLGEQLAKDMIAVPIGPPMRMAVVGAPSYFEKRALPKKPQDLHHHVCINLRLPTRGGLYVWEFEMGRRKLNIRVEGRLILNSTPLMLQAARAGFGLAYIPEDMTLPLIAKRRLIRVLDDWCEPFSGYHLYYPSRRQPTPAFASLVEELRYRSAER